MAFSRFARTLSSRAARTVTVMVGVGVTSGVVYGMTECVPEIVSRVPTPISEDVMNTNSAFVFIKPHACKGHPGQVEALVRGAFEAAGITVEGEGDFSAEFIDENLLIDNHYGAIAKKAILLQPSELNVPDKGKAGFESMFGLTWEDALAQGLVYNAKDGASKLGVDGIGLEHKWRGLSRGQDLIKFGGGFYCGKVDGIFIMNGFYMSMRAAYTTPGEKIHWMTVNWDATQLSWEDFRGSVLGATNPSEAATGSVRRSILDNYAELGLPVQPDTGNNGVHASASPFEAMCERQNWLKQNPADDNFLLALLQTVFVANPKIDPLSVQDWMEDSQVSFEGGKPGSLFDLMEDKNTREVLEIAASLSATAPIRPVVRPAWAQ